MSNLLLAPNTPSSSGLWAVGSGSGTTTEALSGAPDGTSTQFSMSDSDGTTVTNRGQNIVIPSTLLPYRFLYWVEKTVGPITNVPYVDMRFGASRFHSVCLDTTTGDTEARAGGAFTAPDNFGALDVGTHWVLWMISDNNSETAVEVRIGAAFAGGLSDTADIAASGINTFWGGRFEQTDVVPALPTAAWTTSPNPARGNDGDTDADLFDEFTVEFADASTGGDITSWAWDFGDLATSTSQNPTHTYEGIGRYTVSLTVTNLFGSDTTTITNDVWLTGAPSEFPCIAYDNLFRRDDATVSASTEDTGFEKENAYDWRPYTWWKPNATGYSYLTVVLDSAEPATAFAVYAHNLGDCGSSIMLQYSLDGGTTWLNCTQDIMPAATEVIYVRFDSLAASQWRVRVNNPSIIARLGCVYVGPDLELERGCRQGFGPPKYNRDTAITNTISQGGVWLGRSLQYQDAHVTINPDFLTEDFIRDEWMPFVEHAEIYPWFLLWDPSAHADEGAWCFTQGMIAGSVYTKRNLLNATIKAAARIK